MKELYSPFNLSANTKALEQNGHGNNGNQEIKPKNIKKTMPDNAFSSIVLPLLGGLDRMGRRRFSYGDGYNKDCSVSYSSAPISYLICTPDYSGQNQEGKSVLGDTETLKGAKCPFTLAALNTPFRNQEKAAKKENQAQKFFPSLNEKDKSPEKYIVLSSPGSLSCLKWFYEVL